MSRDKSHIFPHGQIEEHKSYKELDLKPQNLQALKLLIA